MNKICKIFKIQFPIVQAGMVWVSGSNLASASAKAGILGLIGAGSMSPAVLDFHIKKAQASLKEKNKGALGVNLPLLYSQVDEQIEISLKNEIKIFFTSAGSPQKYTKELRKAGAIVFHVVSSAEQAKKCEEAGVNGVVAEGFEAGGHNGKDETTTMVLLPEVVRAVSVPVIGAGGIATGQQMAAAFCLGASGVQVGSRFAISKESSAHENFKNRVIAAGPGETKLSLKEIVPVRLLENKFRKEIEEMESSGARGKELSNQLLAHLGRGRAKEGIFEGDLERGELEIGQVSGSSSMDSILSVEEIVTRLLSEYKIAAQNLSVI